MYLWNILIWGYGYFWIILDYNQEFKKYLYKTLTIMCVTQFGGFENNPSMYCEMNAFCLTSLCCFSSRISHLLTHNNNYLHHFIEPAISLVIRALLKKIYFYFMFTSFHGAALMRLTFSALPINFQFH